MGVGRDRVVIVRDDIDVVGPAGVVDDVLCRPNHEVRGYRRVRIDALDDVPFGEKLGTEFVGREPVEIEHGCWVLCLLPARRLYLTEGDVSVAPEFGAPSAVEAVDRAVLGF